MESTYVERVPQKSLLRGFPCPGYVGYCLLLCGLFFLMGYPKPHVDDPYFVGVAETLATSGKLENPYIRNWMETYGTQKFYAHFPFYPYLLAGWFKIAGVSTSSGLLFFLLVNLLTCFSASWFFVRAGFRGMLQLALPWMILSLAQTQGFRPDMVGLCAFFMSALCLTHAAPLAFFGASFFAGVAVLCWPVVLGLLIPLFCTFLVVGWKSLDIEGRLRRWAGLMGGLLAGGMAVFFLFLMAIGFEWRIFCDIFLKVAATRRPVGGGMTETFFGLSWTYYSHFFLGSVCLVASFFLYLSLRPGGPLLLSARLLVWTALVSGLCAVVLYAVNVMMVYFVFWAAFWAMISFFAQSGRWKELVITGFLSLGLWAGAYGEALRLWPDPDPGGEKIVREMSMYPRKTVVFDEVAYRHVFGLRPPEGAVAWIGLRPAPDLGASYPRDKKTGESWVLAESRAYPGKQPWSNKLVFIP